MTKLQRAAIEHLLGAHFKNRLKNFSFFELE